MSVQLTITVPDDVMEWLSAAAERDFRTPEGQASWLIKSAWAIDPRRAPGNARQLLSGELRKLHVQAGMLSTRAIEELIRQAGGKASHTTIAAALSGTTLPSWRTTESLVRALGGDTAYFHALWAQWAQSRGLRWAGRLPALTSREPDT